MPTLFETPDGIIVLQDKNGAYCQMSVEMLAWEIERLIWIAFYQNSQNDKCFLGKLPKDIITNYIFKLLGRDYQGVRIQTEVGVSGKAIFDKISFE